MTTDTSGNTAPILVTGAGGFIGRAVLAALGAAGERPRAMVRQAGSARKLAPGVETVTASLAQAGSSLAGTKAAINLAYDFRASPGQNAADVDSFVGAMAAAGVPHLVHVSSVVVHDGWPRDSLTEESPITGDPVAASYQGSKIAAEHRIARAVEAGELASAVILRPTLVYGPGSRFWTIATVERLRGGPVLLPDAPDDLPAGAPFGLCHCLHVEDLAQAIVTAAQRPRPGLSTYLLSDPEPPTWRDFYQMHADAIGTGTVIMRPYAELEGRLPPPSGGSPDTGPGLAAKVSAQVRKIIGNDTVDRLGAWLRNRRRDTTTEQAPSAFHFDLYTSRGRIDIVKAERELDFAVDISARQRIANMASYLRSVA